MYTNKQTITNTQCYTPFAFGKVLNYIEEKTVLPTYSDRQIRFPYVEKGNQSYISYLQKTQLKWIKEKPECKELISETIRGKHEANISRHSMFGF